MKYSVFKITPIVLKNVRRGSQCPEHRSRRGSRGLGGLGGGWLVLGFCPLSIERTRNTETFTLTWKGVQEPAFKHDQAQINSTLISLN